MNTGRPGSPQQVLRRALPGLAAGWLARHTDTRPRRLPILLAFLTWRCNLSCGMCGVHQLGTSPRAELDAQAWRRIIDDAAALGTLIVSFSGGEALLHPDLYSILSHTSKSGIAVHLCTNATLLVRDHVERLAAAGVGSVSVSLESDDPAVHDQLRGPGTHAATMRGIRLLREHAPQIGIGINALICGTTFHRMPELLDFCDGLGVEQVKFAPIHRNLLHRHLDFGGPDRLFFEPSQLAELDREIDRLRASSRDSRMRLVSDRFLAGIVDLYTEPQTFACFAGWVVAAIDAQGTLLPCGDFEDGIDLNVRSLRQAWRSDEFHRLRMQVKSCRRPCWDTTNTELSLRLSVRSTLAELGRSWRDIQFYFQRGPR